MANLEEVNPRLSVLSLTPNEAVDIIAKLVAQLAETSWSAPTVTVHDGLGKRLTIMIDKEG